MKKSKLHIMSADTKAELKEFAKFSFHVTVIVLALAAVVGVERFAAFLELINGGPLVF